MVGPGDEAPAGAGGGGPVPASPAGGEQLFAALKTAFVQGRLTKQEFEARVGQALAIYAELDALTADIPAAAPAVSAGAEPARQAANKKMIQQGTALVAGLTIVLDVALVVPRQPVAGVLAGILLTSFVAVLTAGLLTLLSWALDRRSGARPAQGSPPGTGGETAELKGAGDQHRRFRETGQDPPHTAQAARRRPGRPIRFQSRPAALTS